MKKDTFLLLCLLFAGAFLIAGCSSTKFEKYDGSVTPAAQVGEVDSVDGIDFWKNGEPNRQHLILGVIEESHHHRTPFSGVTRSFSSSSDREETIAKVAKKNGGDAIVFVPQTPETATIETISFEHASS